MLKQLILATLMISFAMTTGCAAYRTNSDLSFASTALGAAHPAVPVGNVDLANKQVQKIGTVDAFIKKLTLFHADPTQEQANIVLAHKAQQMGADAVIDVTYDTSIGLDTWGQISATGTAVKLSEQ